MSEMKITVPAQEYTLVNNPGTLEFVIKDSDGDEVTAVEDLKDWTAAGASERMADKLMSDVIPDIIGISVGDLQGEIEAFMEEQSQ